MNYSPSDPKHLESPPPCHAETEPHQGKRCWQCGETCKRLVQTMNDEKVGILLAQLGTPDAPTKKGLRKYLAQFLADPRVIEVNRIVWWFVLNFIILPTRPQRSARLYKRIWTEEGSPLLVITNRKAVKLEEKLKLPVRVGMRYGSPSMDYAIDQLLALGCRKIVVFPEYPQYSATTTGSTYDALFDRLKKERWVPALTVIEPYYKSEEYLTALATSINTQIASLPNPPERLILSYHGVPRRYVHNGDPYCCMCVETTNLLRPRLNLPPENIIHCFQSRFGKEPWLEPYTDETIERLAKQGIKRLAVANPGFVVDCLETIDEIGHEGAELFKEHGGQEYHAITCLNDEDHWLDGTVNLIRSAIK
jgi:protoporphyrin/coproporphyrin ferrochelatase